MAEMEKTMALMTQKLMKPGTSDGAQGSWDFWVIRAIVFSISAILTFRVSASASAYSLDYLSFLKVVLKYWVINDL